MKLEPTLTDDTLLAEVGRRLARHRIALDMTQYELAREAGIGKRTLERMEGGGASQLSNLLRVLRVLGLLGGLEQLLPDPEPGPLQALRRKGKERRRVRAPGRLGKAPVSPWTWGDER